MIINILWALALYSSQIYIFPSGVPQPAHVVMAFIFLLVFFSRGLSIIIDNSTKEILAFFCLFIFYVIVSNLSWSLITQDTEFIGSVVFWLYSFLLFYFFLSSLLRCKNLIFWLLIASIAGVLSLLVFWFIGLGRYDFYPRYNAFFNDPNQMAYWVISIFGLFFCLSKNLNRYLVFVFALLCFVLIFATISRSALLGMLFCFAGAVMRAIAYGDYKLGRLNKKLMFLFGFILTLGSVVLILNTDISQIAISRFSTTDFVEQAETRGYSRFREYPEYILFGAGQGLDLRFGSHYEIHSTWLGILFYYGIVGLSFFLIFLYKIFSRLDLSEKIVFLGPVVYGFSTYGARSPIFWFFLATAVYAGSKNKIIKGSNSVRNSRYSPQRQARTPEGYRPKALWDPRII